MKVQILKALAFCRLLNEEGQLSITNLVVISLLTKIIVSPACDIGSIAALITAVGAYHFDKFTSPKRLSRKEPLPPTPSFPELDELRGEVNKIKMAIGMSNAIRS